MSTSFALAVEKVGPEYLELESGLRQAVRSGPAGLESIRQELAHPDPVARLLAKVIIDWAGPRENDFKRALAYLDELPVKMKGTVLGTPSPSGAESYLTLHFADRVTELLALRLAKEQEWPNWKVLAVVFYLKAHKVPSTTSALIRFAIGTTNAKGRAFALETIREIKDPELAAKLSFEIARAKKLDQTVPADVRALVN